METFVRFLRFVWQRIADQLHLLILLALAIILLGYTVGWIWNGGLSSGGTSDLPPPHIRTVRPANDSEGSSPDQVCADFVFQPEGAVELGSLPFANARLYVNGVDVTGAMVSSQEDGQGSLCYRIDGWMSNGWHAARVVYQDTAGEEYDYRWGFRVENSPSE